MAGAVVPIVETQQIQNLRYGHDGVSDILDVSNVLAQPLAKTGGSTRFIYRYDDLHWLSTARGEAASRLGTRATLNREVRSGRAD
jgi:hypothetical protein